MNQITCPRIPGVACVCSAGTPVLVRARSAVLRNVTLRRMAIRRHRGILSRFPVPCRAFCLPVLSLTRTPGGRYMEWSTAFFEPVFELCERGVWFVGLVSDGCMDITVFTVEDGHDEIWLPKNSYLYLSSVMFKGWSFP